MKEEKLEEITLVLGTQCNMHCIYCDEQCESTAFEKNIECDTVDDSIIDFIRARAAEIDTPFNIIFFGGEPLLYWNHVIAITEAMRDMMNVTFTLISNGKGLRQDMVDYINQHQMTMYLSWDGAGTAFTKTYDAMKKKWNLFRQIDDFRISNVLTAYSYPAEFNKALQPYDEEYSRIHGRHIDIATNTLDFMDDSNIEMYNTLDFGRIARDQKAVAESMFQALESNREMTAPEQRIWDEFRYFKEFMLERGGAMKKSPFCRCSFDRNMIVMDLKGNLYRCDVLGIKMGTIKDYPAFLKKLKKEAIPFHTFREKECRKCKAAFFCDACGCRLLDSYDSGIMNRCKVKRSMWSPVFDTYIQHLGDSIEAR